MFRSTLLNSIGDDTHGPFCETKWSSGHRSHPMPLSPEHGALNSGPGRSPRTSRKFIIYEGHVSSTSDRPLVTLSVGDVVRHRH